MSTDITAASSPERENHPRPNYQILQIATQRTDEAARLAYDFGVVLVAAQNKPDVLTRALRKLADEIHKLDVQQQYKLVAISLVSGWWFDNGQNNEMINCVGQQANGRPHIEGNQNCRIYLLALQCGDTSVTIPFYDRDWELMKRHIRLGDEFQFQDIHRTQAVQLHTQPPEMKIDKPAWWQPWSKRPPYYRYFAKGTPIAMPMLTRDHIAQRKPGAVSTADI